MQHLNHELTAANAQLTTSNIRLTRTNAGLDTFVYTASHDLKLPITNLEGLLAVLRDSLPVDVQQQPLIAPVLGLLDSTVSRFRLTIEQLTELIRLQQTPAGPVLLGPLVAAVQEDLLAEATAAGAQLEVAIPEGLSVRFAPANLRSIVYNLRPRGRLNLHRDISCLGRLQYVARSPLTPCPAHCLPPRQN